MDLSRCDVTAYPADVRDLQEIFREAGEGRHSAIDCATIALGFDSRPHRVLLTARRAPDEADDGYLVVNYPPLDHLMVKIGDKSMAAPNAISRAKCSSQTRAASSISSSSAAMVRNRTRKAHSPTSNRRWRRRPRAMPR